MRNEKPGVINPDCSGTDCCWSHSRRAAAEEGPADRISSSFDSASESTGAEAIRLALRELGYIDGQNIAIEYRYAEGKRD